jgi:hypothetical protein
MMRRTLAAIATAVTLAACGSSALSVPKTPPIAAARACLHRHGMTAVEVPASQLRSLSSPSEHEPVPVAELHVVKRAAPHTRMLVVYFAAPAAATTAANGDLAAVLRPRPRNGVEIQQAAAGTHHGRVLLLDYHGADLISMLNARHCTTGMPVPTVLLGSHRVPLARAAAVHS